MKSPFYTLVLYSILLSSAAQAQSPPVTIPGTRCTLQVPDGWTSQPGSQGAVLTLVPSDQLAQIMINVTPCPPESSPSEVCTAMKNSVDQGMLSTGTIKKTEESQVMSHGMTTTFCQFVSTDPQNPGSLMMTFTPTSSALLSCSISVAQSAQDKYKQIIIDCIKSLQDPGIKVTTEQSSEASPEDSMFDQMLKTPNEELPRSLTELAQYEKQIMEMAAATPVTAVLKGLGEIRAAMAVAYARTADPNQAIAYLKSAVQLDPSQAAWFETLADVLDECPSLAAPYLAQSYYEDALALAPDRRACRTKLAASYLAMGEFDQAMFHYEKLAVTPDNKTHPGPIKELTLCYLTTNQVDQGIAFYRSACEKGGQSPFSLALAVLLKNQGQTTEAVNLVNQVKQTETDQAMIQYADTLLKSFTQE